jgi:hypothetical protein
MRTFLTTALITTTSAGALFFGPATANANPGDMPPCPLQLALLCSMVPALPNLDHDIDLTQDPHALDGEATMPGSSNPQPHN